MMQGYRTLAEIMAMRAILQQMAGWMATGSGQPPKRFSEAMAQFSKNGVDTAPVVSDGHVDADKLREEARLAVDRFFDELKFE